MHRQGRETTLTHSLTPNVPAGSGIPSGNHTWYSCNTSNWRSSMYFSLLALYNKVIRQREGSIFLLFSFYRWGNWGTEWLLWKEAELRLNEHLLFSSSDAAKSSEAMVTTEGWAPSVRTETVTGGWRRTEIHSLFFIPALYNVRRAARELVQGTHKYVSMHPGNYLLTILTGVGSTVWRFLL